MGLLLENVFGSPLVNIHTLWPNGDPLSSPVYTSVIFKLRAFEKQFSLNFFIQALIRVLFVRIIDLRWSVVYRRLTLKFCCIF